MHAQACDLQTGRKVPGSLSVQHQALARGVCTPDIGIKSSQLDAFTAIIRRVMIACHHAVSVLVDHVGVVTKLPLSVRAKDQRGR